MTTAPIVLLVDDDQSLLDSLVRGLRSRSWVLRTASSAEAAAEILAREPVAVMVTDDRMPGLHGWELLVDVRREHPQVVPIMLTGTSTIALAMHAINDGRVFRFLVKPCPAEEVAAAVEAALLQVRFHHAVHGLLAAVRGSEMIDTPSDRPMAWLGDTPALAAMVERLESAARRCSR